MPRVKSLFLFICFIFPALLLPLAIKESAFPEEGKKSYVQLTVKGKKIRVEVAHTEVEKARGLMFREGLEKDEGMLFIFQREEILTFWMKNTLIPLSIAFIDHQGRIVDIQDMEPLNLRSHASAFPAKYALEMNQGWFKRNGIGVGDMVTIPSMGEPKK